MGDYLLQQMAGIYRAIKKLREEKNYTQQYVAGELGIDCATYSRMENGKIDLTISRLIRIAKIFHVDPDCFFQKELHKTTLPNRVEITLHIDTTQCSVEKEIETKWIRE
jgi:transcriptional regulator with XRE-family HTH domain